MKRALLASVSAIALLAASAHAQQQPAQDAAQHFGVGIKLYQEKAYPEALAEFEIAYKLSNRPNALKNIAQCHRDMKHFADAYEAYEKMLSAHGAQLNATDKSAVERALAELSILTGTVMITSAPTGATITLDGKDLGQTPLEKPKRVNLGAHTIRLQKAGFEPFERELNVGSEQAAQVDAKLDAEVTTGHVTVREQAGREVRLIIDGQDVGALPWTGDLPPGDHTLESKGPRYGSDKQVIKVVRKDKLDVVVDATPTTGHLRVTVTPASAKILVDGVDHGNGSWEADVTPGAHRIAASLPGYPDAEREVTVDKGQLAIADIPLVSAMGTVVAKEPVYKGFYGRWSTPVAFGFGATYDAPPGVSSTHTKHFAIQDAIKLQMGYSFGVLGIEAVTSFIFSYRNDRFSDVSGEYLELQYPVLAGFFGAGPRVTSMNRIFRVTGAFALGFSPHQIGNSSSDSARYVPCENNGSNGGPGQANCNYPNANNNTPSPGYTSFAINGDLGILIGPAPGAKFWLGVDWFLDFAPELVVQPDARLPARYTNNGGVTLVHGPQFYIGPSLGVGFGH